MGEQERADVAQRATHQSELVLELAPLTGQAGVDDRDLARFLNQIAVDDV
jgi:hypothetical protein